MRGRRMLVRFIPLITALVAVMVVLSGRPTLVALAASCVPGDNYETNQSTSEACLLANATTLNGLQLSADFTATGADNLFILFPPPPYPAGTYDIVTSCSSPATDEDWFSFNLQQGFDFAVTVTNTGESNSDNEGWVDQINTVSDMINQGGHYGLEIFDPGGATYRIDANTGNFTKTFTFTVPTTGTYKVRMYPLTAGPQSNCPSSNLETWGGDYYTWTYNLVTTYTPPTNPVVTEDPYEQNDFSAVPYDITLPFSASDTTIFPAGDDDWFRFLGAVGNYNISVGSAYGVNLLVELYGPGSSTVPIATGSGTNPILTGSLPQNGFYLVRVDSVVGTEQTLYTLSVSNTPTSVAEDSYEQNDTVGTARLVTAPVSGASASLYPANDPDFYLFAANPGTISVGVTSGDSSQYSIQLISPSNTVLASAGPSPNPSISNFNATAAGNYKLAVTPATTTQTGNYTFSISTTANSGSSEDPYEQNDNAGSTYALTLPVTLTDTTIFPASDPDFFRFFSNAGTASINIYPADTNMRFDVNLVNPDGSNNASVTNVANPAITATLPSSGNYRIEIFEITGRAGGYSLTASYSQTTGPVAADAYEENDTLSTPRTIGATDNLTPTIFPASDPDYFQFFATATAAGAPASIRLFTQNGAMNYTMRLYDPDGAVLQTDTGANPEITRDLVRPGYYTIEIIETTATTGAYTLYVNAGSQAGAVTATPTSGTPAPTPSLTPTPDMGGNPDIAEYNNDWASAFRIAPGNEIGGLNFNGGFGVDDIDFFVMNVKTNVTYTCETYNLGLGTDTIMSIYGPTADTTNLIGTHDDVDSKKGDVRSKLTWKSAYQGQVYIVIDQVGSLTYPGAATYDFACDTGTSAGGSSGSTTGGGGGGGASGGSTGGTISSGSNAVSIEIIGAPERVAQPEPAPAGTLLVNVLCAYDENANGLIDLQEGVLGMSIRAIDVSTNKQLAAGFTDSHGNLQLIITAPQGSDVMIVVPFLSVGKTFSVSENSTESWRILLPASLLPGFIP